MAGRKAATFLAAAVMGPPAAVLGVAAVGEAVETAAATRGGRSDGGARASGDTRASSALRRLLRRGQQLRAADPAGASGWLPSTAPRGNNRAAREARASTPFGTTRDAEHPDSSRRPQVRVRSHCRFRKKIEAPNMLVNVV